MKWFHTVHCGDILELVNSCVRIKSGSQMEFKKAEVIDVGQICDVFMLEELKFVLKFRNPPIYPMSRWGPWEVKHGNLREDLWIELTY